MSKTDGCILLVSYNVVLVMFLKILQHCRAGHKGIRRTKRIYLPPETYPSHRPHFHYNKYVSTIYFFLLYHSIENIFLYHTIIIQNDVCLSSHQGQTVKSVDADSSDVFGIFLSVISLVVLLWGSWSPPPFKSSRRPFTTKRSV